MTREEFINILEDKGYPYKIKGDKIIVKGRDHVSFHELKEIPADVQFNNNGSVFLDSVKVIPAGVHFNNKGGVILESIKAIPADVQFNNEGSVNLKSLKVIPAGVQFNNNGSVSLSSVKVIPVGVQFNNREDGDIYFGDIYLNSLIGGSFGEWEGNIEGVHSRRLLNLMISKGLFER